MLKKIILSFFVLLSLVSCDYFDGLFQKKAERIDFTSIDEYPQFPSCDSLATKEIKVKCFEETVANYIQNDLEAHNFSSNLAIADALIIHIIVDREGNTTLQKLETSDNLANTLPELETVISESVANFPILKPARKRDLYVKSKFMIPLYIVE